MLCEACCVFISIHIYQPYLVALCNVTKQIITVVVTEKHITKEYVASNVTHTTHPNKTHKTDKRITNNDGV